MRQRRRLLAAMVLVHALAAAAPWFAPYDSAAQHRDYAWAPPMRPHVRTVDGRWRLPFVCAWPADGDARLEDCRSTYPIVIGWPSSGEDGGWRGPVRASAPGHLFLLGTDRFGRDQLSRLLVGARTSLLAALAGTALAIGLALVCGLGAAALGGRADALVTGGAAVLQTVPMLYVLLTARAALPLSLAPSTAFVMVTLLLGLAGWAGPYRPVRAAARAAMRTDYVLAARAAGAAPGHIVRWHLLEAVRSVALAQALVLVPRFMLAEVTLSFFGLGVSEPAPSWGAMLAEALRAPVLISYTWMLAPLVALVSVSMLYYGMILAFRTGHESD